MLGEVGIAGDDHIGQFGSSAKAPEVRKTVTLRGFRAIHYGIVKIIYDFFTVFTQSKSIKGIQFLLVKEDTIEICCTFEELPTCQRAGWQLCNFAIYAVCPQGIDIDCEPLSETWSLRIRIIA